jgi:hypothetical protein
MPPGNTARKETTMQGSIRSLALLAVASALVVGLSGCGGDGGGSPVAATSSTPPPPPPPPVTTTVVETEFPGLDPLFLLDIPFTTTEQGTLKAKVQWKSAADHIILYLVQGGCNFNQLVNSQCDIVASSEAKTPKPRVLTLNSARAGKYHLYVGNLGPNIETISALVTLTTGGSSSSASDVDHRQPELTHHFTGSIDLE